MYCYGSPCFWQLVLRTRQYMLKMHASKKLGALMEEDCMGAACISSASAPCCANQQRRFSMSGVYDDILNISPRLSYHNPTICLDRRDHGSLSFPEKAVKHSLIPSIASNETPQPKSIHLEKRLHERCFSEKLLDNRYVFSVASNEIPLQKPVAELVNEIADLELEVVQLERYLLSLYRTAFEQLLPSSHTVTNHSCRSLSRCHAASAVQDAKFHQAALTVDSSCLDPEMNESHSHEEIEKSILDHRQTEKSFPPPSIMDSKSCSASPERSAKNDMRKSVSGHHNHHSLADHLGASIIDRILDSHCKLSEDIVRCISAVYCKLANSPTQPMDQLASSTPSLSSSSTFSPQDPGDSWSPRCHSESASSPSLLESLKIKHGPYSSVVEVPKICVDGDKFEYASKMLSNFRSLIRRLDTVDPRKMDHGEQLAFWINVHNALVMHAFLAYGLHQNNMKSTSSVMKAAYNVGGHSVNACLIQRAILGCQLHRPGLSLRSLFTPAIKYLTGNVRHPYALERSEPLVHFALCSGAYSDPIVHVYTAKGIHQELKLAKAEFIQANVSVHKENRIILPKILQYYAKDASLELSNLMEMICECIPEAQQRVVQQCLKRKGQKCIEWSSYKLDFRYLVHRDLAKGLEVTA